jgi:hypothetical protein
MPYDMSHPRMSDMHGYLVLFAPTGFEVDADGVMTMHCSMTVIEAPRGVRRQIVNTATETLALPAKFEGVIVRAAGIVQLCAGNAPGATLGRPYRYELRRKGEGGRRPRGWGMWRATPHDQALAARVVLP